MINMDDKPTGSMNPIKSSNEILSELFGAFNAEPPSIDVASGLNQQPDDKTHNKKNKRHKSTKKHKTVDETEANDRLGVKKKHKLKKHKRKRKSKKHKRKSMSDSEGKRKDKTKKKGCKKRTDGRSSSEREDSDTDKSSDDSGVETLELNVIKSQDKINVKNTESIVKVEMTHISANNSHTENKESDSHTLIEKVAASSVVKNISTGSCNATESVECEKKDDVKGGVADAFEATGGKLEKSVPEKRKLNFGTKITIKNLKNSTVFEETVRQVEEQARLKAEKYEEGEISDESSDDDDNGQSKSGSGTPLPSPVVVVDSLTKPSAAVSVKCSKQQHVVERGCHRHKTVNTTGGSPAPSGSGCKHRAESKERRRSLKKNSSSRSPPRSRHKKRSSRSRSKENRESDRRKKDHHRHHHHRHSVVSSGRKRRCSVSPVGRERDYRRKRGLRSRSRSRSRSPYSHSHFKDSGSGASSSRREECQGERERDREKIDKRRLLEIARKNALNMLKQTSGAPGGVIGTCTSGAGGIVEQTKATIAAGGKTVDELTDFCKLLSKKDAEGHESISSNTSNNNSSESESEKPFHHPFQLKDRPQSIVMNIRNSVSVPVKTLQEKTAEQSKALRLQFPVSSGQLHRKKESDWVPVSPKRDDDQPSAAVQHYGFTHTTTTGNSSNANVATAVVQPVPITAVSYSQPMLVQSPVGSPLLPVPQQPPRSPIQVVPMAGIYQRPPMPPEQVFAGGGGGGGSGSGGGGGFGQLVQFLEEPSMLQAASTGTGTGGPSCSVDITMAVNHRLSAMKRLQQNPHDVEALAEMNKAQQQAQAWVESKSEPGHFTGSTGARVLSAAELASGAQAWARKDQLNVAAPVQSGMGMAMLQKMGWKPGEGLGKNKEGTLEPLKLQVKMDKKGLVASDEVGYNQPQSKNIAKNFYEGKHPVSLLNELCSRKRYGPPIFDCCYETGPDHKKMFIFKVTVNGVEYKPSIASQNKKQAKVEAATLCLRALGLIY